PLSRPDSCASQARPWKAASRRNGAGLCRGRTEEFRRRINDEAVLAAMEPASVEAGQRVPPPARFAVDLAAMEPASVEAGQMQHLTQDDDKDLLPQWSRPLSRPDSGYATFGSRR